MISGELKYAILQNLEDVLSKADHHGSTLQYLTINSSYSEFYLTVELLVRLSYDDNIQKLIANSILVENFFFFKNDGEDVKEFWFNKNEIEKYLTLKFKI